MAFLLVSFWPPVSGRGALSQSLNMFDDTLLSFGGHLKSLGEVGGKARIGGYLVVFGSPHDTDLVGDWFSPDTYFGVHEGNGADTMIHHGLPLKADTPSLDWTRDKLLTPLQTRRDDVGLFAETVCDLADQHEAKIYDLVQSGKLKWSSGAAAHTVRRRGNRKSGEIVRWPIIEGSLTPTPCQVTGTSVTSLKAFFGANVLPTPDMTLVDAELDLALLELRLLAVGF